MTGIFSGRAVFQRRTLVEQIADSLRVAIRDGSVSGRLPPERELCRLLNASRPMVRQAIHRLRDEGLLRITQGHPAEIVETGAWSAAREKEKRVVLLFAVSENSLTQWFLQVIDEMRRVFYDLGFHFELVMEPGLSLKRPGARLERLLARHQAEHWILAGVSAAVQEWFQGKALNVVTMGNAFPGSAFPFVNDDLKGVTRHAASVFLGLGHQNIVFLMRDMGLAGEAEEEAGFRQAFRSRGEGRVFRHSGRVEPLRQRLQAIFSQQPPVTALLVSHAEDTLVVINWFLERGIRLPRDVSLISFQWESFLERLRPQPAWYYTDPKKHARKLCRLVAHPGPGKKAPSLIFPVFHKNDTLRAL